MATRAAANNIRQFVRRVRQGTVRTVTTFTVAGIALEVTTHIPSQGRSSDIYTTLVDEYVTPFMRRILDPETAHHVAIYFAQQGLCPQYRPTSIKEQRVNTTISNLFPNSNPNLQFTNPIGLAAGFDKDGEIIKEMLLLGFGSVEIGTVTPMEQPGNPKPRMFRLLEDNAIINRYGFNSAGSEHVVTNIQQFRTEQQNLQEQFTNPETLFQKLYTMIPSVKNQYRYIQHGIVGINIGKNKITSGDYEIIQDYQHGITKFTTVADYIVLNISSPNTPGLRDLQYGRSLQKLIQLCIETRDKVALQKYPDGSITTPLLLKIAPDLSKEELITIATVCKETGIDGIIVSNTTDQRPVDLISSHHLQNEPGGLSGKPLKDKSTECIRVLYQATAGTIPIIGVGGISSGQDAYEKFKAGASLIQIYSCMIYAGPGIVRRIRNELAQLMIDNGHTHLQNDVVGSDHETLHWEQQQYRRQQSEQLLDSTNVVVIDTVDETIQDAT